MRLILEKAIIGYLSIVLSESLSRKNWNYREGILLFSSAEAGMFRGTEKWFEFIEMKGAWYFCIKLIALKSNEKSINASIVSEGGALKLINDCHKFNYI